MRGGFLFDLSYSGPYLRDIVKGHPLMGESSGDGASSSGQRSLKEGTSKKEFWEAKQSEELKPIQALA